MSFLSAYPATSSATVNERAGSPGINLNIDLETSALIAKLALEDLEEVYGRRRGKARVGAPLSDEEYAYQLQSEQFNQWITAAEDAKIARSLREASMTDAACLEALIAAEQAASDDRLAAQALSRGEPLPAPKPSQIRIEDPSFVMEPEPPASASTSKSPDYDTKRADFDHDDAFSDDDSATAIFDEDSDSESVNIQRSIMQSSMIKKSFSSPSVAGPSSVVSATPRPRTVKCTICDDSLRSSSALSTPCGHYYCRDCVRSLVEAFTRDESLYPLRCCQEPIPIKTVIPFMASVLRKTFEAKNSEFSVLSKDRLYCCNPTCSAFLGSCVGREDETGIACTAQGCITSTCPRCKQAAHPNDTDCAVNHATIEVRALARQQGWQTCPGCHMVVELHVGCYHMTCRCRTQFCYLCAVPWKGCTCPQWDEGRLVTAAEQRAENEMGARAVVQMQVERPAQFAGLLRNYVDTLRDNHDCERHTWSYRHGGGRCSECHFDLPSYLLICRGCSLLACVRCSRNRF